MEEIHRGRYGGHDIENPCPSGTSMCSSIGRLSEPSHLGGFMEVSLVGMIEWIIGFWWLNSISIPSPWGDGKGKSVAWEDGCWKFQPSYHGCSIWWPAPTLKLSRHPQSPAILLADKKHLSLWRTQGYKSCVPGTGKKTKYLFLLYHRENLWEAQYRSWESEPILISLKHRKASDRWWPPRHIRLWPFYSDTPSLWMYLKVSGAELQRRQIW